MTRSTQTEGSYSSLADELSWFAQQLPGCLIVYDRQGRCLLVNGPLQDWLRRPEDLLGRTMFELWPANVAAQEAADLDLVLEGVRLEQLERRPGPRGDGPVRVVKFPWMSSGLVEGMAVVFEPAPGPPGEWGSSGRLERLALGILNDFSGSLALLRGQLGRLEALLPDQGGTGDALDELRRSFDYVCQLPRQLLDFVHVEAPARQRLDVNALLGSLEGLLCPNHPGLTLEHRLQPGGAWVEGDPLQLGRAFLNLAHNALDSLPSAVRGQESGVRSQGSADSSLTPDSCPLTPEREARLCLETRAVSLEDVDGRPHGEIIRVVIHAGGPGPAAEEFPRLFAPLTSRPGRGSGLGLSIVEEVVRRHGGWTACQKNAARGARFLVHLPAAPLDRSAGVPPSRVGVLVVERDPDIRHLTALILEQGPFLACSAAGLEPARQSAAAAEEPIALVVAAGDLCGSRGHPALVELLRQLPGAGLLVTTSGEPPELPPLARQSLCGYLPKPYSADFLLRAAEEAVAVLQGKRQK